MYPTVQENISVSKTVQFNLYPTDQENGRVYTVVPSQQFDSRKQQFVRDCSVTTIQFNMYPTDSETCSDCKIDPSRQFNMYPTDQDNSVCMIVPS